MRTILISILAIMLSLNFVLAQTNELHINSSIKLPKDTIASFNLIKALNGFLDAAQRPNEENKFVYEQERVETFILLDEIWGIQKSKRYEDDQFYKPYLNNLVALNDDDYQVQLSYIGIDNQVPLLRASFKLIARKSGENFKFSSPLLHNTKDWKSIDVGHCTFHSKDSVNINNINLFVKNAYAFDQKLGINNKFIDYYLCHDFVEVLDLFGVQYKVDYNGRKRITMVSSDQERGIKVLGRQDRYFDKMDLHDLWHDRLSMVISRKKVNKTVDEGCAYLYGGSWGMSWDEIFDRFVEKVAISKNVDWVLKKEKHVDFGVSQAKHLYGDYVVNALIVQYLEKEFGFSAVWQLLINSQYEKGNQKYYESIEKLAGITKANYNKWVEGLIELEKRE